MEEIKVIIDAIAGLPQIALWVLIGFWCYKVVVVGSIYGVIRFTVAKLHDAYVNRHVVKHTDVSVQVNDLIIKGETDAFMVQLRRLVNMQEQRSKVRTTWNYMHHYGVDILKDALDLYEAKVKEDERNKAA